LGLRQRFEAIYEKLTDTRNLLNRVESNDTADATEPPAAGAPAKPDEKKEAATPETYERIRRGGKLERLLENLEQLSCERGGRDEYNFGRVKSARNFNAGKKLYNEASCVCCNPPTSTGGHAPHVPDSTVKLGVGRRT